MLLERMVLKPLERTLYFTRGVRGFRRLDLFFTSSYLSNRRVNFACEFMEVKFQLLSNPSDDLFTLLRSNNLSRWEPGSLELWTLICKRSSTVIDIGAYSGIYSILAAKNGVANVISVEPNPNTRHRLQRNLKLNKIESCTVLSSPLGEDSGVKLGLYVPESNLMPSGMRLESSGARYLNSDLEVVNIDDERWLRIETHETSKLDDLIDINRAVNAMKIDAEGMEIQVLKGSEQILRKYQPHLIIETWSEETTKSLNAYLKGFGYNDGLLIDDQDYNQSAKNIYFSGASNDQ